MAKEENLKGISGWLMFFFIMFILWATHTAYTLVGLVFSPLIVRFLENNLGVLTGTPDFGIASKIILALFLIVALILQIYTIVFIGKRQKEARKVATITVWFGLVFTIVQGIINYLALPEMLDYYQALQQGAFSVQTYNILVYVGFAISIIVSIAWALIVTFYFARSRRVKRTLVK